MSTDKYVVLFINLIHSYDFHLISDGAPSRPGQGKGSTIDFGITNCDGLAWTEDTLITDHFPIVFGINNPIRKTSVPENLTHVSRNLDNCALERFKTIMIETNWDFLNDFLNIDSYYAAFINRFMLHYNDLFPLLKTDNKRPRLDGKRHLKRAAPWINHEIKKALSKRNCLARSQKKGPITLINQHIKNYRIQRNRVSGLIKKAKRAYYEQKIGNCLNGKGKWRDINKILGKKRKSNNIGSIEYKGALIDNEFHIANAIGDFFRAEPEKIIGNIGSGGIPGTITASNFPNSFFLSPATYAEIKEVVLKLKTDKALGIDGISPIVLKYAIDGIVAPLTGLANLMFDTGTYPTELKVSRILPIYKKGDKLDMANYRPISLISVIAKALEKMIFNRIHSYLRIKGILVEEQFGFRDRRSTELALLDFWDGVLSAREEGSKTLAIFLDLTKAFDCINHQLLLNKLEAYGLRGNISNLLKSYLKDRTLRIRIGNSDSSPIIINRGVPQGSSLGPLLFIIYINDLVEHTKGIRTMLYADDITCLFSGKDEETLINKANQELERLVHWMMGNELVISYKKSKYMLFGGNERINKSEIRIGPPTLNNASIERVHSFRLLGIWFDDDLKWKTHICNLTKDVAAEIGKIRSVSKIVQSREIILQLYYAFVHSKITYGITLWGNNGVTSDNAILQLQKRCARIACGLKYRDPVVHKFASLGILTFNNLYRHRIGTIVHGILGKTLSVDSLLNLFTWISSVHTHDTRNSMNLYVQGSKTNSGWRSFRNQGPLIWNSIPSGIKSQRTTGVFKKNYMTFLLLEQSPPI